MHRISWLAVTLFLAACDDSSTAQCTGDAPNDYAITFTGTGFDEHEARPLFAMTDIGLVNGGNCRSTASASIIGGAFDVRVANRTDDAVYPRVAVFIDLDGDGACQVTDLTWASWDTVVAGELSRTLEIALFAHEAEPCMYFSPL